MTAQIIPFARICVYVPPIKFRRGRKRTEPAVERPAVQVDGLPIRLTIDEALALWNFAGERIASGWSVEDRDLLIALTSLRIGLRKSLPKAIAPD